MTKCKASCCVGRVTHKTWFPVILHPSQSLLLWMSSTQPIYSSTVLSFSPSVASTNNPQVFPKSFLPSLWWYLSLPIKKKKTNQTKALTLSPCLLPTCLGKKGRLCWVAGYVCACCLVQVDVLLGEPPSQPAEKSL